MKIDGAKAYIIESIDNIVDNIREMAEMAQDGIFINEDDLRYIADDLAAQIPAIKKLRSR